MLNGLDLFSGIGGMSLALREWVKPVVYCEIDPYCQAILLNRMADGSVRKAPIWDDIRTLSRDEIRDLIDIIYGGFPCQDISIAGRGKGLDGERSGLYWETYRLAKEIKPTFIFLENVPGIISKGCCEVADSLAEIGYDCRWDVFSAEKYVDQKRDRWFLLAKLSSLRRNERACEGVQSIRETSFHEEFSNYKLSSMECWGSFARSVRKDNGVLSRVDRIRALGNAVVPQQAKEAFKILMGL